MSLSVQTANPYSLGEFLTISAWGLQLALGSSRTWLRSLPEDSILATTTQATAVVSNLEPQSRTPEHPRPLNPTVLYPALPDCNPIETLQLSPIPTFPATQKLHFYIPKSSHACRTPIEPFPERMVFGHKSPPKA